MVIHAEALTGTLVYDLLVNRAVPIFLVLFGLTSSLWWQNRGEQRAAETLAVWVKSRLIRLLVPVWAILVVWWPLQLVLDAAPLRSPVAVVSTFLGYMPWVSTGWFVTLILELVVLFPLIRWLVRAIGIFAGLLIGLLATIVSFYYVFDIIEWMQVWLRDDGSIVSFFYFWIFAPAYLWNLTAGIGLATVPRQRRAHAAVLAAVCFVLLIAGKAWFAPRPVVGACISALADVPLAVILLWVMSRVTATGQLDRALSWCGRYSWGLYIGQMLIHSTAFMVRLYPSEAPIIARWIYFLALVIGAIVLVRIGEGLRRRTPLSRVLSGAA